MSERERGEDELQGRLFFETSNVRRCLDESGHLLYDQIPPERVEQMRTEVGEVRNLVEQVPIHLQPTITMMSEETNEEMAIMTSVELFTRDMDRFFLQFVPNSVFGKYIRQEPYARRFQILFPGLDGALIEQEKAYEQRLATLDPEAWPRPDTERDEKHAHALMAAYAATSQLVDADDICVGVTEVRVRDRHRPESVVRGGR